MNVLSVVFYVALIGGGLYLLFRHAWKTKNKPEIDPVPDECPIQVPEPSVAKGKAPIVHRVKTVIKKVAAKKHAPKKK